MSALRWAVIEDARGARVRIRVVPEREALGVRGVVSLGEFESELEAREAAQNERWERLPRAEDDYQ